MNTTTHSNSDLHKQGEAIIDEITRLVAELPELRDTNQYGSFRSKVGTFRNAILFGNSHTVENIGALRSDAEAVKRVAEQLSVVVV